MKTFIKGFLIGLGKIVPGVSGSVIALSLGVYEKCIDIICNLFTELKYNIKFILLILLGFISSIFIGSKIIYYFLNKYYFITISLFIGLIIGSSINFYNENKIKNRRQYFLFIFPFIFFLLISLINFDLSIESNITGYITTFLLGFIDALTMIVPGISGTAIFISLGIYDFILLIYSELLMPFIFFYGIGIIFGIYITSKVINYFFKNFHDQTYLTIFGFLLASLVIMIFNIFINDFSILNLLIGIVLSTFGYFFSKKLI